MRKSCGLGLVLAIVSLLSFVGRTEEALLDCQGPSGTYRVAATVSCSEAMTAKEAAERYLDSLLQQRDGQTPDALATLLEDEASTVCDQRPEKGTVGDLLGIDRWGCDAGYVHRNLCEGYFLERVESAEYGYSVVYHVILSTNTPAQMYFDTASAVRWRTSGGDVRVLVGLALRADPTANAPAGYEEVLKAARKGQARAILNDALGYCEEYEADYCRALRSLAARIMLPPSSVAPEDRASPIELVVTARTSGHLSTSHDLHLTSQDVSLISVSGSVTDEAGRPLEGVEVRFREWDVVTTTDAQGDYRLSSFGTGETPVARRADLTLQHVALDVAVEERPGEGGAYLGVTADGTTSLSLRLAAHGIQPDSITIRTPRLGRVSETGPRGSIGLDDAGISRLLYTPPSDVAEESLSQSFDGAGDGSPLFRTAVVPLIFDYVDLEGAPGSVTVEVFVCQAPVVLLYPFAADRSAWVAFSEYARGKGFDVTVIESFVRQSTVGTIEEEAQSVIQAVADRAAAYAAVGIKCPRIDLIAHSAAGLAARRAVAEWPDSGPAVRRLLLVAAPNHGIAWLERASNPLQAWLDQHPAVAREMGENSDFLRQLNAGESSGAPLDPNVQVVNLFGSRTALRAGGEIGLGPTEDDGFVSTASAHLEGVAEVVYDGVRHSETLPFRDIAIAGFADVWARLVGLLRQDTPPAELHGVSMELRSGGGPVDVSPQIWVGVWTNVSQYPISIRPGTGVRTGKGGYASIAVYGSEGQWGSVGLDEDSEFVVHSSSPRVVRIQLLAGQARFRRIEGDAPTAVGVFEVVMTAGTEGTWYTLRADARVIGRDADFVVAHGDGATLYALDGQLMVETNDPAGAPFARWLQSSEGIRIQAGGVAKEPIPTRGWWTRSVWREPTPPFSFPMWILPVTVVGALVAAAYRLRARKHRPKQGSTSRGA